MIVCETFRNFKNSYTEIVILKSYRLFFKDKNRGSISSLSLFKLQLKTFLGYQETILLKTTKK